MLCSRRTFLQASLAGILTLACADPILARMTEPRRLPEGSLSLFNTHTSEELNVTYRDAHGNYDQHALESLDWFFRCHYNDKTTRMDPKVIEFLNMVDKKLGGGNTIHIISGYRSPEYNRILRKTSNGVAKRSLHMDGMAIDITIPDVKLDKVKRAAERIGAGGVGYYPKSQFVHLDSGRVRSW